MSGLWLRRHACATCRGQSIVFASGAISLPDGQRMTCICRWHDGGTIAVGISFRRGRSYALHIAVNGRTAHACVLAAPRHWNLASALGAPGPGAELSEDIAMIARKVLDALAIGVDVVEVQPESSDLFARSICTGGALEQRPSLAPLPCDLTS